jgi:hypothetical protein
MDAPEERGVWFVLRGGRRVGAVVVNARPRSRRSSGGPHRARARARRRVRAASHHERGWVGDTYAAGATRPAGTPLLIVALISARRRGSGGRTSRPDSRVSAPPSLLDAIERLPAFARVINTLPAPRASCARRASRFADATLVAALARRLPTRFLVVVADGVPLAERLLADLHTLLDETPGRALSRRAKASARSSRTSKSPASASRPSKAQSR